MNNHFIPQFILKRFAKTFNIFNVRTGECSVHGKTQKIFSCKNIYSDEVEVALNKELETPFNNILERKILPAKGELRLTRIEAGIVNRYALATFIRTQVKENKIKPYFEDIVKDSKTYFESRVNLLHFTPNLPTLAETGWDEKEVLNNCLMAVCECKEIHDYYINKHCFLEFLAFAEIFNLCYTNFWDSAEGMKFVLTDNGIIPEYEPTSRLLGVTEISKRVYCVHELLKRNEKLVPRYAQLITACKVLPFNYLIFNLCDTKCLVYINPFFKLYFPETSGVVNIDDNKDIVYPPVPDMWPSMLSNIELFRPCQSLYVCNKVSNKFFYSPNDIFVYPLKRLTIKETLYANMNLITSCREYIGYDKLNDIAESLFLVGVARVDVKSFNDVHVNNKEKDIQNAQMKNMINDPIFGHLLKHVFDEHGYEYKLKTEDLFYEMLNEVNKDFETNRYLYWYFKSNISSLISSHLIDFVTYRYSLSVEEYVNKKYNELYLSKED